MAGRGVSCDRDERNTAKLAPLIDSMGHQAAQIRFIYRLGVRGCSSEQASTE